MFDFEQAPINGLVNYEGGGGGSQKRSPIAEIITQIYVRLMK